MNNKLILICTLLAASISPAAFATQGYDAETDLLNGVYVETAFSPEAGAEALVLKAIDAAQSSLLVAAYSFTSPPVTKALIAAKRRGVDVRVLVDKKGNEGKASLAALNLVVNAGIPTRTISVYAIHHDKYMVIDGKNVETGSFNYSRAAARSNSENVVVIWNSTDIARKYADHWQTRWQQGEDYRSGY